MEKVNEHFKPMLVAGAWIVALVCTLLKLAAEHFGWGLGWEAFFNGLAIIPMVYVFTVHFIEFRRERAKRAD